MGITIFILLFSIGSMALLAVLLKTDKIQQNIFAVGMVILVIFDFSLLSLDKIYFLHQAQDDKYLEKQRTYDEGIAKQLALYQQLTNIQLEATLQILAQNAKQTTEKDIVNKIKWRDNLLLQMNALSFDDEKIKGVSETINGSVIAFLMERLNQEVRQSLGHRIYSEFVRSRPRHEWTDELFVAELTNYLNNQNLMNETVRFALSRLNEFQLSGVLISLNQPKKAEELNTEKVEVVNTEAKAKN